MALADEDIALSKALRRRKELQDDIKSSVKKLEKIEEFLRMYRQLSTIDDVDSNGEEEEYGQSTTLSGVGVHGQTQQVFEQFVCSILRDTGRPMKSGEIAEVFRERGHPIGGNEMRNAWNKLWKAKARGVLVNIPRYGYWLADEPLPENALAQPPIPPKRSPPGESMRSKTEGKPRGRKRSLTESQVKTAEKWLLEGWTFEKIGRHLGGVSRATISRRFPGGRKAVQEKHMAELAADDDGEDTKE